MASTTARDRLPPLAWVALALAATALALAHRHVTVTGPDAARFSFDSAEYALAGRTWFETGRLATPFVHPAALGTAPGPPFPLLVGHPLVPALDALAFAVAGRNADATLLPPLLAFVACVLLVARLALALAGSRIAALAAAAAFATSPWALHFACEGRTEMPFAALLTWALLLLWELGEPREFDGAPRPLALGIALGLAHLARPVVVPLLPAFALGLFLLSPRGTRMHRAWRSLAGFLPLAALTAIYQWTATGTPFAGAGGYLVLTGLSPEWAVARLNRMTPPPDAIAWLRAHPGALAGKVARNLFSMLYGAWSNTGRVAALLAALAAARAAALGDARERGFVITLALLASLLTLLASATVADPRMLFPLLPAGVALAFAGLARLAEPLGPRRRAVLAAVASLAVLAGALPLARDWRAHRFGDPAAFAGIREREWRALGTALEPLLPRDGLVASDAPPWIAWYARRPATAVPLEPAALLSWPERLRPRAVVLTNEYLIHQPLESAWRALYDHDQPPDGFRFEGRVRAGRVEAAVFTRGGPP
jgi:4-amino-4-deoxy-L-arabinose transferase-like glycosyltransferase